MNAKRPCVFFDRDGIVNASPGPGYVERWADFHLLPPFIDAVRVAARHGFVSAVITNQRGIATGILSSSSVAEIHAHLTTALAAAGAPLLGVYMCPHARDACSCRKPQPGLLLEAARDHDLDLSRSWMVGDQPTDVEAGRRAGCRTILVNAALPIAAADYHIRGVDELPALLHRLLPVDRQGGECYGLAGLPREAF